MQNKTAQTKGLILPIPEAMVPGTQQIVSQSQAFQLFTEAMQTMPPNAGSSFFMACLNKDHRLITLMAISELESDDRYTFNGHVLHAAIVSGADQVFFGYLDPTFEKEPKPNHLHDCRLVEELLHSIGVRVVDFMLMDAKGKWYSFEDNTLLTRYEEQEYFGHKWHVTH